MNTLFVDKNLQYHGLIQAFSRTNGILKTQGNIVCFRNLKEKTYLDYTSKYQDLKDKVNREKGKGKDKVSIHPKDASAQQAEKLIDNYLFTERTPLRDEVLALVAGEKPGLLQRKGLGDRILQRITDFVETFINGMAV